jgi:hypothetical protein
MRILVVAAGARARQLALGLPWPVAEGDPRRKKKGVKNKGKKGKKKSKVKRENKIK